MSRDDLGRLLRGLAERDAEAPPFDRVWRAALERRAARRPRRRLLQAAVAVAVVLALLFVLTPASVPPEAPDAASPEAEALARSLSGWRGPLDFLLEPPGGHLFGFDPRAPALALPAELSTFEIEEIL